MPRFRGRLVACVAGVGEDGVEEGRLLVLELTKQFFNVVLVLLERLHLVLDVVARTRLLTLYPGQVRRRELEGRLPLALETDARQIVR